MAITITEAVAEIVTTSNLTSYDFGSFTPATSSVLLVLAGIRTTVAVGSMSTVSGTSLTWHRIGSGTWNSGADTMYAFWAYTPSSTTASVYRINVTEDAGAGCIAYMFSISGADMKLNPIRQIKFNAHTASANANVTFDVAKNTNNGYCAAWWGALSSSNPANVSTPPSGWTEIGDNGYATPTTNGSGAYRAGGETTAGVTFTNSSTNWGCVAVEIYDDGLGPSGLEINFDRNSQFPQHNRRKVEIESY